MEEKLKTLLEHVVGNVDYYKKFESLISEDVSVYETLRKFPIITKKTINENKQSFFSDYARSLIDGKDLFSMNEYLIPESTSGSSGFPLICYKSRKERFELAVDLWKRRQMIDEYINQQDMFCLIHVHPSQNTIINDTRNLHPEAIQKVLQYLSDDLKPRLLHSTPSDLEKYADYILGNKMKLDEWQLSFIESNSELLTLEQKEKISAAFKVQVINSYGSREVWNIAYECPEGALHVSDNILVEIVDLHSDQILDIDSNEYGEVVVTNVVLHEYPFIRYRMGDIGALTTSNCPCGLKNHILILNEARKINMIHQVFNSGKIANGVSLFKGVVWDMLSCGYRGIERYKIIQTEPTLFNVYLVMDEAISENFSERFRSFAIKRLEHEATFAFHKVHNEDPIFAGKSYSFISKIN